MNLIFRYFSELISLSKSLECYSLCKVANEEQLMRLYPKICQIIKQNSVISRSGWVNQHQGLDAILEEINKTLKALISPIPSQKH